MAEQSQPYLVTQQTPVACRSEIGYEIARIVEKCEDEVLWTLTFDSLVSRLELMTNNFVHLRHKF